MDSVRAEIRVHLAVYIPFRKTLIIHMERGYRFGWSFCSSSFFLWREGALYIVELSLSASNVFTKKRKITVEYSILIFPL